MECSPVPPAFAGKPHTTVEIAATRRSRDLVRYGFYSAFWFAALIVLCIFTFIGAIVAAISFLYCLGRWRRALPAKSFLQASCPHCDRQIVFWGNGGFECPHCKATLLMHEDQLFRVGTN